LVLDRAKRGGCLGGSISSQEKEKNKLYQKWHKTENSLARIKYVIGWESLEERLQEIGFQSDYIAVDRLSIHFLSGYRL
jgi:hypothetical protein